MGHLEIFCLCFLYCQGVLNSRGPTGHRAPLYLNGSMKQYRRLTGGGPSSAVGQTGGGEGRVWGHILTYNWQSGLGSRCVQCPFTTSLHGVV
jgi:hypothetical protein